ncbi:MAG: hypothetical protein RSD14_05130, partial [Clostridia bacterium]
KSDLSLSQSKKIADSNGEYNITTEKIVISDTNTPATFSEFIPSINAKYAKLLGINRGKLIIGGTATEEQISWAAELGISALPKIGRPVGENTTFDGEAASATNPVIPKDFTPINEGGANWGQKDATNNGLVIKDKDKNEFVWIPVPNFKQFVRTDDYYNGNGLTTAQCSELKPGESNATEELKAMYKSVEKNGGFYIARYEAGNTNGTATDGTAKPVSRNGVAVWMNIPWGEYNSDTAPGNGAVSVARAAYPKDDKNLAVVSTLVYGVQYDAVLRFIETSEGKTLAQIKDSTLWGNYYTSSSKLENAGSSDSWKSNNIYDLAGNVCEWTMEVYSTARVNRSGSYYSSGSDGPVSYRSNDSIGGMHNYRGFRVGLYIK